MIKIILEKLEDAINEIALLKMPSIEAPTGSYMEVIDWTFEHPGLNMLGITYGKYLDCLSAHQIIDTHPALLTEFSTLAKTVYKSYITFSDGGLHNVYFQIEGEPEPPFFQNPENYNAYASSQNFELEISFSLYKKIDDDLRQNASGWTIEKLLVLAKIVQTIEVERTWMIVAIVALVNLDAVEPTKENLRADVFRRFVRIGGNFKKSFAYISSSGALSNMAFAVNETIEMLKNRSAEGKQSLTFRAVANRLYTRYLDYYKGRGGWQLEEKSHESFDDIAEIYENGESIDFPIPYSPVSDSELDRADFDFLRDEIKKLPETKRLVLEKYQRHEKLNACERKILSRFKNALKEKIFVKKLRSSDTVLFIMSQNDLERWVE